MHTCLWLLWYLWILQEIVSKRGFKIFHHWKTYDRIYWFHCIWQNSVNFLHSVGVWKFDSNSIRISANRVAFGYNTVSAVCTKYIREARTERLWMMNYISLGYLFMVTEWLWSNQHNSMAACLKRKRFSVNETNMLWEHSRINSARIFDSLDIWKETSGETSQSFCAKWVWVILIAHPVNYRPRSEASEGYVFTGICLSNEVLLTYFSKRMPFCLITRITKAIDNWLKTANNTLYSSYMYYSWNIIR